jgi:hypothetical protein
MLNCKLVCAMYSSMYDRTTYKILGASTGNAYFTFDTEVMSGYSVPRIRAPNYCEKYKTISGDAASQLFVCNSDDSVTRYIYTDRTDCSGEPEYANDYDSDSQIYFDSDCNTNENDAFYLLSYEADCSIEGCTAVCNSEIEFGGLLDVDYDYYTTVMCFCLFNIVLCVCVCMYVDVCQISVICNNVLL